MRHFRAEGERIVVSFTDDERSLLGEVIPMLTGAHYDDPTRAHSRLPVYPGDPEADGEWWRFMGPDLDEVRTADRRVLARLVGSSGDVALDEAEADAVLRVFNETRLLLGARLGIRVEEDYDDLPDEGRRLLDYFGWLQEELMEELSRRL